MLRASATAALGSLVLVAALAPAALADDGVGAGGCASIRVCVHVDVPGKPGDGGTKPDRPGHGDDGGGITSTDCSIRLLEPQPPAGSSLWEGHEPGDGAVYVNPCLNGGPTGTVTPDIVGTAFWSKTTPDPAVNPAVLAQRAVDSMLLGPPAIGIAPKPGGTGVVGMPVYLWTETGPETYGPNVASASAGGTTVTATAKVSKIVWEMGDGTTVTCTTPGTPYRAEFGKAPSPDCGHQYRSPSKYHATATSTWSIDWAGGGQSGQLTQTRASSVDIAVGEVQVVGQ